MPQLPLQIDDAMRPENSVSEYEWAGGFVGWAGEFVIIHISPHCLCA